MMMHQILILTALAFILLYSVAASRLHISASVMFERVAARSSNLLSNNVIAFSEKILNNKAAALNNLGQYNESLIYSTKPLAIAPNNVDALTNKGIALEHLGNYTGAIEYYDKALAINPKDKATLNNKAATNEQYQRQFCSRSPYCSET